MGQAHRFLGNWLLSALAVWPLALISGIFVWLPIALFLSMFLDTLHPPLFIQILRWIAALLLPGLIVATIIGEQQINLFRHELAWQPAHWLKYTCLGGMLGSFLIISLLGVFQGRVSEKTLLMLLMPLFATCISLGQYLSLRKFVREAWLWVLANLVGGIVFSGLFFMNQPALLDNYSKFTLFALWLLAVLAQASITGIVLLHLFDRLPNDAELAPAYVEVYSDDEPHA